MWPWNLVPTQVGMLGNDVPWVLLGMLWCVRTLVFLYYSRMICRAGVRWWNLGLQFVRVG